MVDFQQLLANSPVATRLFPVLADSAVKACLIIAAAALVAALLRKSSAASRHLVWVMALAAVTLVPVLSTALPKYRILPSWLAAEQLTAARELGEADADRSMTPGFGWDPFGDMGLDELQDGKTAVAVSSQPATSSPGKSKWAPLASAVCLVWGVGFFVMLLRMGLSRWVLHGVARTAEPLDGGPLRDAYSDARGRLDVKSSVHIAVSARRSIPMMWGILKTYLLLPLEAREWEPGRLRAVLLHELGHVKRRDTVVHALVQLVCAAYWFHPLAWFAAWRIHVERERACDDVVLRSGVRPSEYAGHLLEIMTRFRFGRAVPCGALAMARTSQLEGRVLAILNENISRKPLTSGLLACAVFVGVTAATAMATLEAKPVLSPVNQSHENPAATTFVQPNASGDREREAEAALRRLGARVQRNDHGEVVLVFVMSKEFTDAHLVHLKHLSWSDDLSTGFYHADTANGFLQPALELRNTQLTAAGLTQVAELVKQSGIRTLNLSGAAISDSNLPGLLRMTSVRDFHLNRCAITDAGLQQHATTLSGLRAIGLGGTDITDAGLAHLSGSRTLEYLRLSDTSVTDEGIAHLKGLPRLTGLNLENTLLSDKGLAHLESMQRLESLDLTRTKITDDGLRHIANLTPLKWLFLSSTEISDAGLKHLGRLKGLEGLLLKDTKITDAGLSHLAGLTNLEWLWLSGTKIDGSGLAHLANLNRLERLWLSSTGVVGKELVHLRKLTDLVQLILHDTNVGDEGLAHMKSLTRLSTLDLINTNVSDRGLVHLEGLTNLRGLYLQGTEVDDEGVERLKQVLLNCEIQYDGGVLQPRTANVTDNSLGVAQADDAAAKKQAEAVAALKDLGARVISIEDGEAIRVFLNADNLREGLAHLKELPQLAALNLDGGITDLEPLEQLTNLRGLAISGAQIKDADLKHLKGMSKLEGLALRGGTVSNAGLVHLKGLTSLRLLHLQGTKVTDPGLEHLKQLSGLQELGLNGTKIGGAGLEHLKGLGSLKAIALGGTQVIDAELEHLKALPALSIVGLEGTKITDAGLEHLKEVTGLQFLYLARNEITDNGLQHLKDKTSLKGLNLAETNVSDAGLEYLKGLKNLKHLNVEGTDVSDDAVEQLHEALPVCKITYDGGVLEAKSTTPAQTSPESAQRQAQARPGTEARVVAPISDAEAEAELKRRFLPDDRHFFVRNENGAVLAVRINHPDFDDQAIVHLTSLNWAEKPVSVPWPNGAGVTEYPLLTLFNTRVTNAGVERIIGITRFQCLAFTGNPNINDATLELLGGHTDLKELHLGGTNITGEGLKHLQRLTGLRALLIQGTKVDDSGLRYLKELKKLKVLYLGDTLITNDGLAYLKELPTLEYLWVRDPKIGDAGLVHVKSIASVRSLRLDGSSVTDDGLAQLSEMTNLSHLWLMNTRITGSGLAHLTTVPRLRALMLNGSKVRDPGLESLKGFPNLSELTLRETDIGDSGLAHLKEVRALQRLVLADTNVTSAGLAHLSGLTGLAELSLARTDVTDQGLEHLSTLRNLQRLDLRETEVTADGVAHLQAALPRCEIEYP